MAHGQAHDELTFDDSRPLRQAVDEAAWLLGLQFVVQVIPSIGNDVASVLAGQIDSVLNRATPTADGDIESVSAPAAGHSPV